MYAALKHTHLVAVAASIALFALRGAWMMLDSPMLARRWVKIVPHVVDTVLLVSAVVLAISLNWLPAAPPWLIAKIVALVVYIGLGMLALRPGRPKPVRVAAFAAALAVFVYIVLVALSRSPLPFGGT